MRALDTPPSATVSPSVLLAIRSDRLGTLPSLLETCGVAVAAIDPSSVDADHIAGRNLVVQDFSEAGEAGVKAAAAVREAGARLVALVDDADPGYVCDLYRAGAAVVFNRSVGVYHVFLQCCAFLQIWHAEHAPTRVGAAVFEPGHRRLRLDEGSDVHLTEAESKILAVLAGSPERYVGRSEISETVFRIPYDKFDRRIDVHVSNLRKKFRQHEVGALIDTSRLKGFRLVTAEDKAAKS